MMCCRIRICWPRLAEIKAPPVIRGRIGGAQKGLPGRTAVDMISPVAIGFPAPRLGIPEMTPIDNEVVELALLLPRWQAVALENAAHEQGISTAQMLRKLINSTIRNS